MLNYHRLVGSTPHHQPAIASLLLHSPHQTLGYLNHQRFNSPTRRRSSLHPCLPLSLDHQLVEQELALIICWPKSPVSMLAATLDLMARRFFPGQNAAFGLSVFLFTFMFLPTLVVLLAVIVFFLFYFPRLRKPIHD
ncbi:uncharacterized protein BO95DRAFT_263904 [Aspergillus brunneoviolaceus CBS 621.78]|uniref:Uncharacterized protein n=1 Tax=Aspergillus brunneoviolaceus CBS 621.78 TaxID=1450534 RepID=A0ACD1FX79_9EURO|nr:hypothetical protein BO95DRAFT_263904 [Aspergillus brunneoviolaceus CBS 621.78]RAH41565.1 hypothetical protein BO95DRAFT_263904 [Aspergillus brunneoviolaceus CBS 621.78]